jgi:hypothetical protein
MIFAVNGNVYYSPFPLVQPSNWEDFRLKNIKMSADVDQFVFTLATKSANLTTGSQEFSTPSHRIVMIQDGISYPAYWDGSDKVVLRHQQFQWGIGWHTLEIVSGLPIKTSF